MAPVSEAGGGAGGISTSRTKEALLSDMLSLLQLDAIIVNVHYR